MVRTNSGVQEVNVVWAPCEEYAVPRARRRKPVEASKEGVGHFEDDRGRDKGELGLRERGDGGKGRGNNGPDCRVFSSTIQTTDILEDDLKVLIHKEVLDKRWDGGC